VTINGREPAAEPGCLDATTRDVLIKLIGRAIDLIGVDTARALTPALVGYLAGVPYEGGMLAAAQRARAVAAPPTHDPLTRERLAAAGDRRC